MKKITSVAMALMLCLFTLTAQAQTPPSGGTFEAGKGTFLLNGKPFVVKAAELHYPRIPRPYWDQRIKLCKALGMNAICLYVFWNAHESRPGEFDFTGQNDLAAFCRLCQDNGMYVILRPGPYVCAEWEMGGLPWWLLKKKDIRLRENDPYFMERVALFEKAVANQVKDLTIQRGGPIVMIQVENEYGAYGVSKEYVGKIRDMLRQEYGQDITLFQCDWSSNFELNGLPDLVWTMNFGTGANIDQQFARLKEVRPDSPLMCSEFWSGWFDKWGANHETRPAKDMVAGIDEMLSKGISFSLYMTHGGTNWGHWAGANSPSYAPDVTSYDYDAPISESGQTTPKYFALRKTLAKYMNGEKQARIPKLIKPIAIQEFRLTEVATGFKTFSYLQRLLENGYLNEETLLMIDEPEAHLHPQWIVEFARMLVLLHKVLGLKIMVASHNPDMVSAIHDIANKEGILDHTCFYVARQSDTNRHAFSYEALGHEIGEIFESFNIAIDRIREYGAAGVSE